MKKISQLLFYTAFSTLMASTLPTPNAVSTPSVVVNNKDLKAKKTDFWKESNLFSILSHRFDLIGEQMPKDIVDVVQIRPGVFVVKGQVASQEFKLNPGTPAERVAQEVDLKDMVLKVANFKLEKKASSQESVLSPTSTIYFPKEPKLYQELTAIFLRAVTDPNHLASTHIEYLSWDNLEADTDTMIARLDKLENDLKYLKDNLEENNAVVSHTRMNMAIDIIHRIRDGFKLKNKKTGVTKQKDDESRDNYFLTEETQRAKHQHARIVNELLSISNKSLPNAS